MAFKLNHDRNNAKFKPLTCGTHRPGWGCGKIPQSIYEIKREIKNCDQCRKLKFKQELCSWHEDLFLVEGENHCGDPRPSPKVLFKRAQEILK